MEQWRPMPDFEQQYEVSDKGNVRSLSRFHWNGYKLHWKEGLVKKLKTLPGNYRCVGVSKDGGNFYRSVHRLVAKAFIPNPQNLPEVNHINNDPSDNRVENLEWCTRSHNSLHCYRQGRHPNQKFSREEIEKAKSILDSGGTQKDVMKAIGCSAGYASMIKNCKIRRLQ